jgi:type I restriction enzyme, R subunit
MDHRKPPEHIRIDERNLVKKPLLEQLTGRQWEALGLDKTQAPRHSALAEKE